MPTPTQIRRAQQAKQAAAAVSLYNSYNSLYNRFMRELNAKIKPRYVNAAPAPRVSPARRNRRNNNAAARQAVVPAVPMVQYNAFWRELQQKLRNREARQRQQR
jgi:hypothetical protein